MNAAAQSENVYPRLQMFIDNDWTEGSGTSGEDVRNPATLDVLGRLPHATRADLDRAVAAAERGFQTWSQATALERKHVLNKAAQLLRARAEDIGRTMVLEQGKALAEAKGEVAGAADIFEWYGDEAVRLYGRLVPSRMPNTEHRVVREPVGPVAGFSPWNFPALTPARKIAGALGAGCSIVIKAAEETPATAMALVAAYRDAGLPDGVLNLVFGVPSDISEYLIPHPAIAKVSFTGSIPVGKHLAALAAQEVKPCTLELGGHAPVVVFDDADVDQVVKVLVAAKYRNAGQVCIAPSRFFIQGGVYDRFVDSFAEQAAALSVGGGLDPGTQMGPVINGRRIDAMQRLIDDARETGCEIVTGGERMGNTGYFWQPTVVRATTDDCLLMREEPFGPVAPIARFDDASDMISRANGLPFGLAAYAFTGSRDRARWIGGALKAGMVGVNSMAVSLAETPFGGVKESGYGSEGGTEGLNSYLVTKLITETVAGS